MSATEMHWVLVTDAPLSLDWPDNQLLDLEVDGKKITLAKFKEGYFAFAQKCPHASGRMAQGYINPLGQVVCPLHRYAFDMKNGRNTTGGGLFLKNLSSRTASQWTFYLF